MRLAFSLAVATAMVFPTSAAAFNPDSRCYGLMVSQWTVEVEPGAFEEGQYTFWWRFTGPAAGGVDYIGPMTFTVSDAVPVLHGNLFIYHDRTINPDQDGYFWAGFVWDMTGEIFGPPASTMPQVHAELDASAIYFNVAPGAAGEVPTEWVLARGGPAGSACANTTPASYDHRTYPSS
jgi:hypothetical protein